jgi:hypothetical protein
MKTFISILTLAFTCLFFHSNLHAQNDTEYVIVEYMKVKPGMWDKYRECEKAWKLIHQNRVKAGYITGWELEEVIFPSGTDSEYDFLTITHVKNWKAINDLNDTWTDQVWANLTKNLSAEQKDIANKAEEYRDIVKREIWTGGEQVFAPSGKRPIYVVENFMRIPPAGMDAWEKMETEFVMPVHKKSVELGTRAGWMMTNMVLPRGADYPYQASTLDLYDSWEQMGLDEGKAWEAVHPGMDWGKVGQRFNATRTIAKTEVRRLVDQTE